MDSALNEAAPLESGRGAVAVLDVLDRDAQVRQSVRIAAWPLRIGRALDNDVVLADPHAAPHHLRIDDSAEGGPQLSVGDTHNGLLLGTLKLWRTCASRSSTSSTATAPGPASSGAGWFSALSTRRPRGNVC